MNKVQIFSTSKNPDVYVNAIVHFIHEEHKEGDKQKTNVELVVVFPSQTTLNNKKAEFVKVISEIEEVINNLANGEYFIKDWNGSVKRTVNLSQNQKEFYQFAKERINSYTPEFIVYKDLEKEVTKRIESSPKDFKYIFDLTGEKKYLLVDIVFISLVQGFKELFVFDILKEPNFKNKEENLIHSFKDHEYEFRNLYESKYMKKYLQKVSITGKQTELVGNFKNELIDEKIKNWRQQSNTYLLGSLFLFLFGGLVLLSYANWDSTQAYQVFEEWNKNLFGWTTFSIGGIFFAYSIKLWYDRKYNNSNIQNFKKGLLDKLKKASL
ncbi:MAG: hypothetical protein AAFO07_12835 [Bacteroidota bacterium]